MDARDEEETRGQPCREQEQIWQPRRPQRAVGGARRDRRRSGLGLGEVRAIGLDRRDETIATPRQRLDEDLLLGVVTEHLTIADKDQKITDNGDGTMTILVLATGNAAVYDETGKAIARNPGQVRYEVLIDYGADIADPSDDQFIEFLGLVKGSTGRNDDFCGAVLPVIG